MQDDTLCRSLWPECAEFKEDKKFISHVLFYDDLPVPNVMYVQLLLSRLALHPSAGTIRVD